jgi:hypothetical protein
VRKAGLGLQADLDRQLPEIVRRHARAAGFLPDPQHVLFVDVEIHLDRIERHDGGELRRRRRADQFADETRCALTTPSNGAVTLV